MSAVALPLTFRCVGIPTLGGPLQNIERTVSSIAADEILVRVSYAAINAMDRMIWMSKQNMFQVPSPIVLGYDYSGVVVALGTQGALADEPESITLGSAVTGSTFGIGWGGACFAEYVVAKRNRAMLRGGVPEAESATYNTAYLSAYEPLCMSTDIRNRAGQTIFIPGGAGGVGHFAVQLAKLHGLRVISSSSKQAGLELLRKLGADVVLDYSNQDVVAEVLAATGGKGVDLAFDSTYTGSSMKQSAAVVAKGGQWVRLGTWMHDPPGLKEAVKSIAAVRGAEVVIGDLGRYTTDPTWKAHLGELNAGQRASRQLYADNKVRPHISATVPLEAEAVQQALQDMQKGSVGKVVVKAQ